ncbi:MAG: right-handed parallel beta-helix repeat-containing protein [Acidobacteria bacterium]|nr:right-handed parallel beta-helix repeat-containing protein [Acidobacteriota bacterium]
MPHKPGQNGLGRRVSFRLFGVAAFLLTVACLGEAPANAQAAPAPAQGGQASVPQSNVKAFGARGDARAAAGCSVAARAQTVTCARASFTPADVGKRFILPGAGAAGADLVTTVSAQNGATQISLGAAAAAAVSGKEATYGTDDTAAIQAAVGAAQAAGSGGTVFFPEGRYLTSGLKSTSPSVQFRGQGWDRTTLSNFSATATTVDVYSALSAYESAGGVYDMAFTPAVTREKTANEIKVFVGLPNFTVAGCLFKNVGRALKLGDAAAITSGYWVRDCRYINCWQFLKMVRVIDAFVRDVVGDLARLDNPVGIHLDGGCEGNTFTSLGLVNAAAYDIYQSNQAAAAGGGTDLLVAADEFKGTDAAHNFFVNSFFDSAADGAVFNDGRNFSFTNCWFNGTYRYGAYVGARTDGYAFVSCKFRYAGDTGLVLAGTRHTVRACYAVSNGTRGRGVAQAGFQVAATNFVFTGNFAFNGWGGFSGQAYGLVLEPAADNFIVKDNVLTGNAAQGLLNNAGPPGRTKIVADNLQ